MKKRKNANGDGNLYFREDKQRWEARFTSGGKRISIYQRKNESKTDFKKRMIQLKNEINQGTYIEKNKMTFIQILKEHVENKFVTNKVSERTYSRDLQTIKQIESTCKDILNMPIQNINPYHIKKVLPNITVYSNNVIDKIYRFIKKPFEIAISNRVIVYNPMDSKDIIKPKSDIPDKKEKALTEEEQRKLVEILSTSGHKYKDILLLQLYTGMRIGEILALKRNDIDFDDGTLGSITVEKTLTTDRKGRVILGKTTKTVNSKRTFPMSDSARNILLKITKNQISNINGFLFYNNENNKYITPSGVNSYLIRLNKKEKIAERLHTHTLRHTFTTRFVENGGEATVLQKILGHKNIKTTLGIYTSVGKGFKESEVQKVDKAMLEAGLAYNA